MSTEMRLEDEPAFTRGDLVRIRRSERCHCWTEFGPPRYCPDCGGSGHRDEYLRVTVVRPAGPDNHDPVVSVPIPPEFCTEE